MRVNLARLSWAQVHSVGVSVPWGCDSQEKVMGWAEVGSEVLGFRTKPGHFRALRGYEHPYAIFMDFCSCCLCIIKIFELFDFYVMYSEALQFICKGSV